MSISFIGLAMASTELSKKPMTPRLWRERQCILAYGIQSHISKAQMDIKITIETQHHDDFLKLITAHDVLLLQTAELKQGGRVFL